MTYKLFNLGKKLNIMLLYMKVIMILIFNEFSHKKKPAVRKYVQEIFRGKHK